MITLTDLDQRLVEHLTRANRVDREGWIRVETASAGVSRTLAISSVVASIRQRMGAAVVFAGHRLQGTTVRHAADPSAL